jgi:hypothetical protein
VKRYWVSSDKITVEAVVSDAGIVIDTAPVTKRFVGQPFSNLRHWLIKQGGYREELVEEKKSC